MKNRKLKFLSWFIVLAIINTNVSISQEIKYTINTFCGTGVAGYNGDTIEINKSQLNNPFLIRIFDDEIYVSDEGNKRIRLIKGNLITTVVGNGTAGCSFKFAGKDLFPISGASGIVKDKQNNLYFSDEFCNVVTKVDTNGNPSIYAGTGWHGYLGDNKKANKAELGFPHSIESDKYSNLYIADAFNSSVRFVDHLTGNISTIVGCTNNKFNKVNIYEKNVNKLLFPVSIKLHKQNLYIVDQKLNIVFKYDLTNKKLIRIAGNGDPGYTGDGGLAVNAQLNAPSDIVFDKNDNMYITDMLNNCIRIVTPFGIINTIAGNGKSGYSGDGESAVNALLNQPKSIDIDQEGNLYLVDMGNNVIRKLEKQKVDANYETSSIKSIFPNPASDYVNVKINGEISLIDQNGRILFTENTNKETHLINLTSLKNGIYYIQDNKGSKYKLVVLK